LCLPFYNSTTLSHNPHNLAGIEAIRTLLQDIPNVAVFDTSFHATIPVKAYTYPLPLEYREKDMRKFGFHGTSVRYVSQKASELLRTIKKDDRDSFQMVVCHLGNGASVTAVSGNKSMDTSMGFTPLSGLMMGTRCGDVDPSLVSFACHQLNKDVDQVLNDLNTRSGLKGMTRDGENDMRELLSRAKENDEEAELAVEMFVYHLAQHIAQCLVSLEGPLDALVFTAGIGEHSSEIRKRTIQQLGNILPNLTLDEERNKSDGENSNGVISKEGAWPIALDIATDEEVMIAKECLRLVNL
jgi:acetate kinase